MPLTDDAIFNMVLTKYKEQPIEFIMDEYGKAKRCYLKIEQDIAQDKPLEIDVTPTKKSKELGEGNKAVSKDEMIEKQYTEDDLVSNPEDAIHDDYIVCCLCGKKLKTLGNHITSKHQIKSTSYKKLCGYPSDLPLMSRQEAMGAKGRGKKLADGNAEKRAAAKAAPEAAPTAE